MGNKFSLSRLKKYMNNGSVPEINTTDLRTKNDTTTSTTIEYNSIHSGSTTFLGEVNLSGGMTHSGSTTFNGPVTFNSSVSGIPGVGPLTNVGFSGEFSGSTNIGPTIAAGANQATATALPTGSYIYRCTSDTNTKGIILQEAHKKVGLMFIVINDDATNHNFRLYPTVGGKLNDQAIDGYLDVTKGKSVMLICFDASASPKWGVIGY